MFGSLKYEQATAYVVLMSRSPGIGPPRAGNHFRVWLNINVERPIQPAIGIEPHNAPHERLMDSEIAPYLGQPPTFHHYDSVPVFFGSLQFETDRQAPKIFASGEFNFKSWRITIRYWPSADDKGPSWMMLSNSINHAFQFRKVLAPVGKGSQNSR